MGGDDGGGGRTRVHADARRGTPSAPPDAVRHAQQDVVRPVAVVGLTFGTPGQGTPARLRRRDTATGTGPVIRRRLFTEASLRGRAEDVARKNDRGGAANWVEAKVLLRAEEIHAEGGGDEQANYFEAQRQVDQAWKEYEKLTRGADPATLSWDLMDQGLSREEFATAVTAAEAVFVRTLDASRDLRTATADLKQAFAGRAPLLGAIDRARQEVTDRKAHKEVFDQVAATASSGLITPLLTMPGLAELTAFCEHVAKIHGVSPLDAIRDFVDEPSRNLPIQAVSSKQERRNAIADVVTRFTKQVGTTIPPQPIDAGGRLTPDKKTNVGSVAHHADTLHIEGNPNRQMLLGVGRPGDPQGYQDFAKDYGVWDYESWGAWNKPATSTQFSNVVIDPNNGADVDKVMEGTDANGAQIFDKLHLRLTGVFPSIPAAADKLLAALGLYNEMSGPMYRSGSYHGAAINPLWTLGEINTIAFSPLAAKTAFYGQDGADQNKLLADLFPGTQPELIAEVTLKMNEYQAIGEDVYNQLVAHYGAGSARLKNAVKHVADTYYNIPRGAAWVVANTTTAVP